jgi:hypothetical protein
MIQTFPRQGYQRVVFNATFYRNGKKLNAIEQAEVANFSHLVRSYDKSENPDKVKVEFKDLDKGILIWAKTFEVNELDDELQRGASSFSGLGEAEVNDLVQRKFAELERQKTIEQLQADLQKQREENQELQYQLSDLQTTLDAKKQIEYYSSVIGMALPGLAKFFSGTGVGEAMNFLAGQEEESKELEESSQDSKPDQRQSIISLINEFCTTLNNQELGTLYMLFIELEKDRQNIQRILSYITQHTASNEQQ